MRRCTNKVAAGLGALLLGLGGCRGIVPPGKTTGEVYGGPWSQRFAKPEPKKEEKAGAEASKKAAPKEEPKAPPVVAEPGPLDKPGFVTRLVEGRLWVFRAGTKELGEFLKGGEPAKSITLVGRGPEGMTVRAPDKETAEAYLLLP